MVCYNTNEFRSGLKIIYNNEPYIIINHEFVKPGKGQAFNRVRLRHLISGRIIEKIFKSGNSVEAADIKDITLTYLYNDSFFWYFINNAHFEQLVATAKVVGNKAKWLIEQTECIITLWNREPIIITPPNFVVLKIIEYKHDIKGDTVKNTNYKIAVLNTGAVVKVPIFLQKGEVVKIDTRSGEYVSRVR